MNNDELFGMQPDRFFDGLRWGEVSYDMFVVGAFLTRRVHHVTKVYVGTLDEIAEGVRWRKSPDTLSRVLARLKTDGWVEFTVVQGMRKPYTIRLTGLRRLPHDFRKNEGDSAEVTSANDAPGTSANAQRERDRGAAELPHASEAPSYSNALRGGEDDLGWGDRGSDDVPFSEETAPPDVRKFAERGRALREEREADEAVGEHEFVRLLFEQFPGSYWADDTNGRPGALRGAVHDGEENV